MTELIQIKKKKKIPEAPKDQLIIKISKLNNYLDITNVEVTYKGITSTNTAIGSLGLKLLIEQSLNMFFIS